MKKIIIIISLVAQFLILLFFLFLYSNTMQTFEKIEKSNVILEERNRLLEEALLYSSNADCYLNVSKMLHHRSHEDVSIGEVISDAPFIVFVPSIACEACSENSLMNLSKLIGILGDRLKVICHPDEYKDVLEYCGFCFI